MAAIRQIAFLLPFAVVVTTTAHAPPATRCAGRLVSASKGISTAHSETYVAWRPARARGLRQIQKHVEVRAKSSSMPQPTEVGAMSSTFEMLSVDTNPGISLHDVTEELTGLVEKSKVLDGWVNLVSQHTTTGVMINEMESRLVDDFRHFLMKMAPASQPYLHNDIHARPASQADMDAIIDNFGEDVDIDSWRDQEPRNAHAHLMTMLCGSDLSGGRHLDPLVYILVMGSCIIGKDPWFCPATPVSAVGATETIPIVDGKSVS